MLISTAAFVTAKQSDRPARRPHLQKTHRVCVRDPKDVRASVPQDPRVGTALLTQLLEFDIGSLASNSALVTPA
jgi:hypothetical protein